MQPLSTKSMQTQCNQLINDRNGVINNSSQLNCAVLIKSSCKEHNR